MATPRLGRPDIRTELEALARLPRRRRPLLAPQPSALQSVLSASTPPVTPASRRAVQHAAGELAERLRPVPAALDEIIIRVRRHCARGAAKDAELADQLDRLQEHVWPLWLAATRLARVAAPRGGPER